MIGLLKSRVSPEARIVTLCSMQEPASVMTEIEACARLVRDWGRVVELAQRHRVAAVILPQLEELADRGAVQSEVVDEIRRSAFADIAATARLRVALKEILAAIGESNLDVIVFWPTQPTRSRGPFIFLITTPPPSSRPVHAPPTTSVALAAALRLMPSLSKAGLK